MLKKIARILWKDILTEFRTREMFSAMFVFALLMVVVFNFAFENAPRDSILQAAPGLLWVAFTFAGILGLNRSNAIERENMSMQALMLAPIDRGAVYLGKMLANFLFMWISELLIIPIFAVLYNYSFTAHFWPFLLILVLGTLGFSAVGTIFSGIAVNTKMRDVMLPILFLPVVVPVVIGAVETSIRVLAGEPLRGMTDWLKILVVFDVIFITVSFLVFEYVLEE
ncbi:MAG: heme exporter protein CcmB [Acidobacteriia bacterium]|nr:heme exporter protein CcmB [Terriglobia bacterium]